MLKMSESSGFTCTWTTGETNLVNVWDLLALVSLGSILIRTSREEKVWDPSGGSYLNSSTVLSTTLCESFMKIKLSKHPPFFPFIYNPQLLFLLILRSSLIDGVLGFWGFGVLSAFNCRKCACKSVIIFGSSISSCSFSFFARKLRFNNSACNSSLFVLKCKS